MKAKNNFDIMIASFRYEPISLLRGQQVACADPHPSAIFKSRITHAKLFSIDVKERHTYIKFKFSGCGARLINKYIADSCKHTNVEEKPVTSDDIDLNDDDMTFQHRIRDML